MEFDKMERAMDPLFDVVTLGAMPNPQTLAYLAARQDYSHEFMAECLDEVPDEEACGEWVVKHLLAGNRGHYGPLEHAQIVVNFGYFPHSTMQQLRTHRNVSFDVQSFRYTSEMIVRCAEGSEDVDRVFYLRPVGTYSNRFGGIFEYTQEKRENDQLVCIEAAKEYAYDLSEQMSEEQARGKIPFDVRQHFVMSGNVRSMMHLLDVRHKRDVQLECFQAMELLFQECLAWMPTTFAWYETKRLNKALLSP